MGGPRALGGPGCVRSRLGATTMRLVFLAVVAVAGLAACSSGDENSGTPSQSTESPTTSSPVAPTNSLQAPDTAVQTTSVQTTSTTIPAGVKTVPEILGEGLSGTVTIAGYLVIEAGSPRICESLLEVEPPGCGGMSLAVGGSVDTPHLQDSGMGVRWSSEIVFLSGTFSGSKLIADGPPHQHRDPAAPPA